MRRDFFVFLAECMEKNKQIFALTGDLGFGGFDKISQKYPDRFLNTGAAETSMLDIAVGLALNGKVPVVYSITPFLLYRPFEVLRTYINRETIPVIMIGSGRGDDYKHDGFSHFAGDDTEFMQHFLNIDTVHPLDVGEMRRTFRLALASSRPTYINLIR